MLTKKKKFYQSRKLREKLYIVFILGICIYLAFFIIFTIIFYHISIKPNYIQERSRAFEELSNTLNTELNLLNSLSISMLGNTQVRNYLKSADSVNRQEQPVRMELYQYVHIHQYIESIYLVDLDGECVYINYSGLDGKRKNNFDSKWRERIENLKGKAAISINADGAFYDTSYDVLSHMRAFYDIDTQELIGFLVINTSTKIFQDKLDGFWNQADVYFGIQDVNGDLIAEKGESITEERYNGMLVLDSSIEEWDLKLEYVSRIRIWQAMSINIIVFFAIFTIITIIFLVLLGKLISITITRPIAVLVESMQKVEEGRLYRVSLKTNNDEIGILKNTYNDMLIKTNQLINQLVDEEKEKSRLELDVLQEQIKPHFLYNILSSIDYLSLIGDNKGTHESIQTLSRFYKNFLSNGSKVISMQQEIMIAKDYLLLQKLRFGNIFEFEFIVDDLVCQTKVLKLILQPLVENSLIHGIYPKGEKGKITVTISKEKEDSIRMVIYDNGVGIEESMIESIINMEADNKKNFGIKGTLLRLRYFYETEDFYSIKSELGEYTKITLILPFQIGE